MDKNFRVYSYCCWINAKRFGRVRGRAAERAARAEVGKD